MLDVLPDLFLEVLVELLLPKPNQFGPKLLQSRSDVHWKLIQIWPKFHEHLVHNRSWAVLGAMSDTGSKNCSRDLTFWRLLEAKLAGLGAQDGGTDGQVGGTWKPKWGQHGENNRFKNRTCVWCLLGSIAAKLAPELRKSIFRKSCSRCSGSSLFQV